MKSDLDSIRKACGSGLPRTAGALELVKYARERLVLEKQLQQASVGLSDLCAWVLGKRLLKNVVERVSEAWENPDLSEGQVLYAAKDAWASLCIYRRLEAIPIPSPLPPLERNQSNSDLPPLGTPVIVYGEDDSIIARGVVTTTNTVIPFDQIPLR